MSFLKNIFGKKEDPVNSYEDFWNWFLKNEKGFHNVIQFRGNIEKDFFSKISLKLNELKDGFWYLAGMADKTTAELILTADGNIKNIIFVEELVNAAPKIDGWKITALKPAQDTKDFGIKMNDYTFNTNNLFFYSDEITNFPDEIDLNIIHEDYTDENKDIITNGVFLFLDNYIGELNFVTTIDTIKVIGKNAVEKELIPINKIKDFLIWRQKEFIEKYEGIRHNLENDNYTVLNAELENGMKILAVVNSELLNWDKKASHPWIAILTIKFDGSKNNGMPDENDFISMDTIEEELNEQLQDKDGYLNIGRQTSNGEREIYFACKDFRKPSKIFFHTQRRLNERYVIEYEIYKDKYWQSFNRFTNI